MAAKITVLRDAAASCQRDLRRVAVGLKGMGEYPSVKDVVKQVQAAIDALERFMRDFANTV